MERHFLVPITGQKVQKKSLGQNVQTKMSEILKVHNRKVQEIFSNKSKLDNLIFHIH